MNKCIGILLLCFIACTGTAQHQIENARQPSNRMNSLQFSGLFGASKIGLGIKYKSLYRITESMNIGWGIGIDSYDSGFNRNFVPISVEVLGDLFKEGITPFYMMSAGYGIALKEDERFATESRGGLMVDFSLGLRSKKYESQPYISVGYRFQNAYYEGEDEYGNQNKDVIYKRWNVSAGMLF